jgi:plasmid stabilization system protein ParE
VPRKYRVEITAAAQEDVRRCHDYIAEDSPASARRWVDELQRQMASLETFPLRCGLIPEAAELGGSYRHLIFGNYRTIFRVAGTTVWVVRIIHGAQLLDTTLLET